MSYLVYTVNARDGYLSDPDRNESGGQIDNGNVIAAWNSANDLRGHTVKMEVKGKAKDNLDDELRGMTGVNLLTSQYEDVY